jgi:hypothetical protein
LAESLARRIWYNCPRDIPVHLLFQYPISDDKISEEETVTNDQFAWVYQVFSGWLDNVYASNIFGNKELDFRDTICKTCSKTLIRRSSSNGAEVNCLNCCGKKVPGVFFLEDV